VILPSHQGYLARQDVAVDPLGVAAYNTKRSLTQKKKKGVIARSESAMGRFLFAAATSWLVFS